MLMSQNLHYAGIETPLLPQICKIRHFMTFFDLKQDSNDSPCNLSASVSLADSFSCFSEQDDLSEQPAELLQQSCLISSLELKSIQSFQIIIRYDLTNNHQVNLICSYTYCLYKKIPLKPQTSLILYLILCRGRLNPVI